VLLLSLCSNSVCYIEREQITIWKSSLKGLTASKRPAPSRFEWQWDCNWGGGGVGGGGGLKWGGGGAWCELITNYLTILTSVFEVLSPSKCWEGAVNRLQPLPKKFLHNCLCGLYVTLK